MEDLTVKEQNIINNYKAHLAVVKRDIAEVMKDRNDSYIEVQNNQKLIEQQKLTLQNISFLRHEEEKSCLEYKSFIEKARIEYADMMKSLSDEREKVDIYRTSTMTELEKQVAELNRIISFKKEEVRELNARLLVIEEKYNELVGSFSTLREETKQLVKERNLLESDIDELESIRNEVREIYKSELQKINKKIKEYEGESDKEKGKIYRPMLLLQETQTETARKEKNLNTLIARFRKYFTRVFPNQELKL